MDDIVFFAGQGKESGGRRSPCPQSPIRVDAPSPKKILRVSTCEDVVPSSQHQSKSRQKNAVRACWSSVEKPRSAASEKRGPTCDGTSSSSSLKFGEEKDTPEQLSDDDPGQEPLPEPSVDSSEVEVTSAAESGSEEDEVERVKDDVAEGAKSDDDNQQEGRHNARSSNDQLDIPLADKSNRVRDEIESGNEGSGNENNIDEFNHGMMEENINTREETQGAFIRTRDGSPERNVLGSSARSSSGKEERHRPPCSAVLPTRTFVKVEKEIKAINNTLDSVEKQTLKVCAF